MKTQDVKLYAAQRLHWLWALPDNQRRAELAKLRRGVGHAPGDLPELWGSFLLGMPESFQGRSAPSETGERSKSHCGSKKCKAERVSEVPAL